MSEDLTDEIKLSCPFLSCQLPIPFFLHSVSSFEASFPFILIKFRLFKIPFIKAFENRTSRYIKRWNMNERSANTNFKFKLILNGEKKLCAEKTLAWLYLWMHSRKKQWNAIFFHARKFINLWRYLDCLFLCEFFFIVDSF